MGLLAFLLALVIGYHWIERDSLKDAHDGHVSFADIIYFTMISATTTGYGDIVPITESARLFDALVLTPIRIFFILILAGTAYTFVIKQAWNRWIMQKLQSGLSGHVIIIGFGTTGSEAVNELIAIGTSARDIVVIDSSEEHLERAEELGCGVIQADGTRDTTLQAVRVDRARAVIVTAGSDDTSILVTLTARHLAPGVRITVIVRNKDNELLARQAGASTVINPASFAGLLMAGSAQGPIVHDYIADLASSAGRVRLVERPVQPEEIGKSLGAIKTGLGVRIYRDEKPVGFWEQDAYALAEGDIIVEIVATCGAESDYQPAIIPDRPRGE
jgi:voltage-gated potassium channel